MNKQYSTLPTPDETAGDDMALINRWTRKTLTEDEVYTFRAVLCDNEIDRDLERFDIPALEKLAVLFTGKTGVFDHRASAKEQTARIYAAAVEQDPQRLTLAGEPYTRVMARAYMPRTQKNADLIAEIDAGIKKEVSVGCRVQTLTCSVCGTDLRAKRCAHRKGTLYDGSICHTVLGEPTDAYEWSFVAVPAQRGAGVTKAYKERKSIRMETIKDSIQTLCAGQPLTQEDTQALFECVDTLEKQAADGRDYRDQLTSEAVRLGLTALPQLDAEHLGGICRRLSVAELRELKHAFGEGVRATVPVGPQLKPAQEAAPADNKEFRI